MKALFFSQDELVCYHLEIRMAATVDTQFDGWIGAVLRNNLLYACQQVEVEDESLYQNLKQIPLETNHPLYKELEHGFPAPYYLYPHNNYGFRNGALIAQGEIISFSLVLIGSRMAKYFNLFIDAIRMMCSRGMGIDIQSFALIDVCECTHKGERKIIATAEQNIPSRLSFPLTYSLLDKQYSTKQSNEITIHLSTPLSLSKPSTASLISENALPNFQQLVRAAANRFVKLNALYAFPHDGEHYEELRASVEKQMKNITFPILERADIRRINMRATQRKDAGKCILFEGYVGNLLFQGNDNPLLPLLVFMQHLGIGHNLTYGLGKFTIYQHEKRNSV